MNSEGRSSFGVEVGGINQGGINHPEEGGVKRFEAGEGGVKRFEAGEGGANLEEGGANPEGGGANHTKLWGGVEAPEERST